MVIVKDPSQDAYLNLKDLFILIKYLIKESVKTNAPFIEKKLPMKIEEALKRVSKIFEDE